MKASETKLQRIVEGINQYVVPLFQRSYSWDAKEWDTLWVDLLELCEDEQPRGHFIGSIVTMPTQSVPEGVTKYLLIDGQQRLTTVFILLAVLRDRAKALPGTLAAQIDELLLKNRYQEGLDEFKLLPMERSWKPTFPHRQSIDFAFKYPKPLACRPTTGTSNMRSISLSNR